MRRWSFRKLEMWKNATTFTSEKGGTFGVLAHETNEGEGECTLFFDAKADHELRSRFEHYVLTHLERRALPNSIRRRKTFGCSNCGLIVTDQLHKLITQQGRDRFDCPVCGTSISLLDREERLDAAESSDVFEIDQRANAGRDRGVSESIYSGKRLTNDWDLFVSYNREDAAEVRAINQRLRQVGIYAWLDEERLTPGDEWMTVISRVIMEASVAAVFVGPHGIGTWQQQEVNQIRSLAARAHRKNERPVQIIPVLLPGVTSDDEVPAYLDVYNWVDFRQSDPDPFRRLTLSISPAR
jgi:hypothetical protein